jgi:ubiquitin-like-conjugating enzyme ATG3
MEGVEAANGCGEDWMVSSILAEGEDENEDENMEDDFDILDEDGEVVEVEKEPEAPSSSSATDNANANEAATAKDDDDDEYGDMDDYEDDDILVDDDAAALPLASSTANNADSSSSSAIVKTRTYDLSITYDKYYQVPRVWMVGRDEDDQPLTSKQMMEDVISDYANKTVTMEIHPHVSSSCPHASIHPCQHAKVMKAIVRNLVKGSNNTNNEEQQGLDGDDKPAGPAVETYIFIFLKFVSSMIPTINYDFTMEVTANTSK